MQINSQLVFKFQSANQAKIFLDSFSPELDQTPMKRSTWEFSTNPDAPEEIIIHIFSEDAVAYRATINSVLIFAHTIEGTLELIEKKDNCN